MRAILSLVLVTFPCVACSAESGASGDGTIEVVASFYPLAHAADLVGGERVSVTNLTPPGVEPHDLELDPDDLEAIATADVVIYAGGGFQPSVQQAVEAEATGVTIDALDGIDLLDAPQEQGEHGGDEDLSAEASGGDPHVWLDPALYAGVVGRVATVMVDNDPAGAETITASAAAVASDLDVLDREFSRGLARCGTRVLITNHAAFGYLAAAYDLEQEAISGLSPEAEPDPARVAELAAFARAHGVGTIFIEDLASAEVANVLAEEAGIAAATLSPLEGLSEEQLTAGADYLSVMRENLETLRDGLVCT